MPEPVKRFSRLGHLFTINGFGLREGGRFYFGNVIVSRQAIYLICGCPPLRLLRFFVRIWPLSQDIDSHFFDQRLEELDPQITSDPDWPLQLNDGPTPFRVKTLSRSAGSSVTSRLIHGGVTVRCGQDQLWIRVRPLSRRELLQTLSELGW